MAGPGRGHVKRSTQGHRTTQAAKRRQGVAPEDSGVPMGEIIDPRTGVAVLGGITFSPDPDWHHAARMIWDSALASPGVMKYYQPTDLATLYTTCATLSTFHHQMANQGRVPAAALASLSGIMTSLLLTEGDRRRSQIELTNGAVDNSEDAARERSMRLLASYMEDREQGRA